MGHCRTPPPHYLPPPPLSRACLLARHYCASDNGSLHISVYADVMCTVWIILSLPLIVHEL